MATTITWTIDSMTVIPSTGQFVNYTWRVNARCTATNGVATGYSTFIMTFDPNAQDDPYIPYAQLTQAIVVGWVQEALGPTTVTNVENTLTDQLTAVPMPLPWI